MYYSLGEWCASSFFYSCGGKRGAFPFCKSAGYSFSSPWWSLSIIRCPYCLQTDRRCLPTGSCTKLIHFQVPLSLQECIRQADRGLFPILFPPVLMRGQCFIKTNIQMICPTSISRVPLLLLLPEDYYTGNKRGEMFLMKLVCNGSNHIPECWKVDIM